MKDKFSIINTAQKYASKGQIDKAINEWHKILETGADGNILNTIGDLYLKKGVDKSALESFVKAAETFKKDGFYPKAIAMHKKIINIDPGAVDSLIALAKLNAEKGLIGNAIENYFKAAEIFKRDGANERAIMAVEKILQLSPSEVTIRLKVADLYMRIGSRERAANEYTAIASEYAKQHDLDRALEFYEKARDMDPGNGDIFIGLSDVAEKMDEIEKAFEYLQNAHACEPDNNRAMLHYVKLAIRNNRTDEAKKILLELLEANPGDRYLRTLLGKIYVDEGAHEHAWKELLPVADELISESMWQDAREILIRFDQIYPTQVKERLIHIYRGLGDDGNAAEEMRNLAEIMKHQGSFEEALQLYKEAREFVSIDFTVDAEIHDLESKLGVAPKPEPAPSTETTSQREHIISPSELLREQVLSLDREAEDADIVLPGDNLLSPSELNKEESVSRKSCAQEMSDEDFAEKKAEADFYAQQGIIDEAVKIYEHLIDAFPSNEELKKELESLRAASGSPDEIVIEHIAESTAGDTKTVTGDDQEILESFSQEDPMNSNSHFQSGLDLKQKGCMDDAIKEFQIAAQQPEEEIKSHLMIAECYQEMGRYPLAITELTKILEIIQPGDDTYIQIKYELADAYECNKDYNKARELYMEIHVDHAGFRDVEEKITHLDMTLADNDENTQQKIDRVSYI